MMDSYEAYLREQAVQAELATSEDNLALARGLVPVIQAAIASREARGTQGTEAIVIRCKAVRYYVHIPPETIRSPSQEAK